MRNEFTNQSTPLISIIVPIYNAEAFLRRCIDSLLTQTYTNIEILLINDSSPDGCEEICKSYKDQRISYYYKENGGISDARNYGIAHAQGEFVAFVDSDDFVSPDFIETLYRILKADQTEISMCLYQNYADDTCYASDESSKKSNSRIVPSDEFWALFSSVLYYPAITIVWNKLYRRSLFEDIQFPVGVIHEDEATTYKLLYKAQRISIVDDRLYYYRENPNSIMHTKISPRNLVKIQHLYDRYQFVLAHGDERFARKSVRDLYRYITQVLITPEEKIDDVRAVRKELDIYIRKMRPVLTGRYARPDIRVICFLSCTKSHHLMCIHRKLLNCFWDSNCGGNVSKWKEKWLLTVKK